MWCNKQLALFGIVMDCRYLSQYARGHYPHWYRMNVQVWSIYHSGKKGTYHLFPKFDGCMPIFRILAWVYHPCFTKPNIIFLLIHHIAFRIPTNCKTTFSWYSHHIHMILLMEEILHQLIGLTWFNPLFVGFQPCKVVQDTFHLQSAQEEVSWLRWTRVAPVVQPSLARQGWGLSVAVAKRGNQWEWGIATPPKKWKGQITQKWWQVI